MSSMNYRALAIQAARRYGIDPQIFLRQIAQESGFNPRARSSAGALGIAQFMPATARAAGVNPLDPRSALYGAAKMDAANLAKYHNWPDVLSLYNSGRGWSQGQKIGETRNYVRSILGGLGGGGQGTPSMRSGASGAAVGPPPPAAPNLSGARAAVLQGLIAASQAQASGQRADYSSVFAGLSGLRQGAAVTSAPVGGTSGGPAASGTTHGGSSLSFLTPLAKQFGLSITSTTGGNHVPGSYHYRGRAEDFSGNPQHEAALQRYALAHAGQYREVFYTGPGAAPYYVKNGKVYPLASLDPSVVRGHRDHVHIAR